MRKALTVFPDWAFYDIYNNLKVHPRKKGTATAKYLKKERLENRKQLLYFSDTSRTS